MVYIFIAGIVLSLPCYANSSYTVITPASLSPQQEAHMREALQHTIDRTSHINKSGTDDRDLRHERCDANCERCEFQRLLEDNRTSQWYIVDLNNDGTAEYVYATTWDYWNFVLYIAQINENGTLTFLYKELEIPTHHAQPFYNAITQQEELFVCLNGIHYLCCSGTGHWYGAYNRDTYLWRNEIGEHERKGWEISGEEKWSWCCDKDWIAQQRALFQALYDHGNYWEAYCLLHEFEMNCRGKIDSSIDFWMRCDLSLAALKCGYPRKSLVILEALQKDLPSTGVSPKLRKAIEYNKAQAEQLQHHEEQGKRTYDARWLLTKVSTDRSHEIFYHEYMDDLLRATVPDVAAWGGIKIWAKNDLEHEIPWREELFPHSPWSGSNAHVACNRFVTLDCIFGGFNTSRAYGFLWCDVQEHGSIIVIRLYGDDHPIILTSKAFLSHELPDEFYTTLVSWIQEEKIEKDIVFIDRFGIRHDLSYKVRVAKQPRS